MSLRLQISSTDATPPYEQLYQQIAAGIHAGTLPEGSRLPTVRAVAADLGIAPGTVMRTYSLLAEAGLIISKRGRGSVVAAGAQAPEQNQQILEGLAADYARNATALGVDEETALQLITAALFPDRQQ
ncbi:GntR family transcriptional regulator [Boudabousia marimammalium]|uniref:HTH gntR-type domain-containing protein n=1 Tax=Boudabousia marimammalium TaxID=156892 RepID=A0A1Q5PS57_9ACTO|nr:GntR family transcriptional regulator [Boudabousia marimammalium]OKL50418.1 hypothetical protein BM477_00095 [Boudabousia marimammalium]